LAGELKEVSVKLYEEIIRDVIGDSLHPGGLDLTKRVVEVARIRMGKVLDIACGAGASVRFIAESFGCEVIGVDLSAKLIEIARDTAKKPFIGGAEFIIGDAESLPFINSCFDAVICESALSLFLDKSKFLREIYRILKSGGRLVATNIVLKKNMPAELKRGLEFALCIAGAETLERFNKLFEQAGFVDVYTEDHSEKLISIGLKLLLSDSLTKIFSVDVLELALKKLFKGDMIGYAIIMASKP
jgi:SAM-dependent methyltransferase